MHKHIMNWVSSCDITGLSCEMALIPPPAFEFKHLPWTERSTAWEFWSRSLHNFVVAAGVISVKQKHGLLLYLGGMDLQDIYETLAPQSIHIEQGDVIDEYEAAMTMLTEHFNPTRAAGNPRQRGKENREIPRDKTSPVHPQETEAEIMSDSDELKSYTKNNEPEEANISESENREPEPDISESENREPESEISDSGNNPESEISESENDPESEIYESENDPESEISDSENDPESEISDSENNPESEISESENDPESEISESENDPESEISDSENDPESEISDSENNPESEISESENDPESDISDSENDPESEISDSENKPRESGSKQRQPDKPVEIHTSFAIIKTEESERQVFDDDNDEDRVEFRNSNCQRRRLNDHVEIHAPITPSPAMTQSEKSLKSDPQDNGRLSDETVNVSINEHVDSNELNSNSCLDVIATRNHYRKVYTDIKRDTWIPPAKSVTDNGPQFVSQEFKDFLRDAGIDHRRVTPYHPEANAAVERFNSTLVSAIRKAMEDGKDWKDTLPTFLLTYRTTPHPATKSTPSRLMFNRDLRTKMSNIREPRVTIEFKKAAE